MGGWALFIGLALTAGVTLWRLRFPGGLKLFALAAVMLGAAGYAWQGSPGRAGAPVSAQATDLAIDDETLAMRNAMFGRFGASGAYLTPADAMMRIGAPDAAARMLQGGINKSPRDIVLWTQLGTVIAMRDGKLSPAAQFAFRRAIALGPAEPGPWFFMGLAQIKGGDFVTGRASWAQSLALTPQSYGYRDEIATRLALVDYFLANRAPAPQ